MLTTMQLATTCFTVPIKAYTKVPQDTQMTRMQISGLKLKKKYSYVINWKHVLMLPVAKYEFKRFYVQYCKKQLDDKLVNK